MLKFKRLTILLSLLVLISCNEYQKVLNNGTASDQYKMAVKLYETKKFAKALRLFEKITPAYRGKPQMERIQFMIAQANFNIKSYSLAGYYFDRFTKNYPKSSKKEEAAFLSAYSYKLASPTFSTDPTDTNKALEAFQTFINTYPNSDKLEEANKHYKDLRYRLQKKYFEIAKVYYTTADYDMRNYKAAIQAFDNLLADYLGSEFKEEALYYRLKSAHDFVLKSTIRRKPERVVDALAAYDKLIRNFPESKYKKEADEMLQTMKEEKVKAEEILANPKTDNKYTEIIHMDYKESKAANTTVTYNKDEIEKPTENIYEAISIIAKRAEQINLDLKKELVEKLDEFATYNDSLEEVFENKEQIEVSKFYERLPKPTAIAVEEWLNERIYHRTPETE